MTRKLSVLLVEDSEDDAALILRELKKGGYAVGHRRVFSRDAMAAALDLRQWDVVLADHNMPGFNSVDALALVKERKLDMPFIIVSGAIGEETAVAAMKAGAHDFVMKGNLARLVPAVGRELREADNRRLRASAEEQARKESLRAQNYLDIAGTMLLALDARGTVTMVNRKGCEILGRPEQEILGKNWFDNFIPPRIREEIRTMFPNYLVEGGPEQWENTVLTAEGKERIIAWHNATIRNGHNKAVGTLSSGEDITERRMAEDMIRHLASFPELNPNPVLELDKSGNILFSNAAAGHMLKDAGLGDPKQLLPADYDRVLSDLVQRPGKTADYDVPVKDRVFRVTLFRPEGTDRLRIYAQDITGRKKADAELRESEERFRAMFEQAAVGMAQVALDGHWLRVNRRWCDIIGYTREELLAKSFQDLTHPDDVGDNVASLRKLLTKEIVALSTEKRYIRKDRSIVWVNLTVSLLRDAAGAPKYFISVIEDITKRKEAEEAVRKSEQLFRLLAENAKDLIYRVRLHPSPAVEYISPSALALTGHSPEEFLSDPALAARLLPPEAKMSPEMPPRMKGNLGGPATISWRHADGATAWLEIVSHPVLNAAGKLVAVEGVARNVTERKQVEDALRESEEKFRNVAEHSPNMIFINVKGRVVYANHRWEEVMGYTREEFGSPGFDFLKVVIAPEHRDAMREKYRMHLRQDGLTPDEHVVIAKNGKRIPVILSTSLIRYGGENAILGTLTDISMLKRSEEALKKSEEKYRELVENINDVIFSTDKNGVITFISPAVERILGFSQGDVVGKPFTDFIFGEDLERIRAAFSTTLAGELSPSEYRMKTRNGDFRWVRTSSRPVLMDGTPSGLSGVLMDINEQKLADQKIEASLKEKVVLLKEIHHRVKNNLQIIHSLLNMQSRKLKDPVALGAIRESQNRVRTMALIHERLYMSSNLSEIDFREYITQLLHELYSSYGADPDRIRPELELGDVKLDVDAAIPCGLIVNELISNSLKHGFPGDRRGEILVRVETAGDGTIHLEVGDTGAGLPEGLDFRKTETLGLQLVCTLVDQLRGTIRLERRRGTIFVIEFNPRKAGVA
jgi:PAS domain S-box-containing protein